MCGSEEAKGVWKRRFDRLMNDRLEGEGLA